MKKILLIAFASFAALAIVACNKEKVVTGSYTGQVILPESAKSNPAAVNAATAHLKLEVKPDKTFRMSGGNGDVEGKWSFENSTLTLMTEKIAGETVDSMKEKFKSLPGAAQGFDEMKHMAMPVADDGSFSMQATTGMQGSVHFTKDKA